MAGKKGMKMVNRKPMSEETKRKISETVKKRWTEKEYREKVSKAHKHPLPQDWKDNISLAMVGEKKSKETRKRMSDAKRGKPNEKLKGHKVSMETRMKISNSLKGHEVSDETRIKMLKSGYKKNHIPWNKDKVGCFNDEVKNKISNSLKQFYETDEGKERLKQMSKETSERIANGILCTPCQNTSIEIKVEEELIFYGIRYLKQKVICNGKRNFVLDFYIPSLKLVIECNGDYWHNLPERKQRDKELKEYVESTGRKIIFIWEHEINDDWFDILDYIKGGDEFA